MVSILALLTYLAGAAVPAWLLYHFGSEAWYWHVLALLLALALGLAHLPPAFSLLAPELMVGFLFVFLMVWGIGGLFMLRPHRAKHA